MLCNCVSTVTALALTPSWSRVRRGLITDQTPCASLMDETYCDCLHNLLNNKQSTALRTCFNIQSICVLYLYKYNRLFYAKHQTLYQAIRPTRDVRLVIHTANVALHRFKQYTDRNNFINKIKCTQTTQTLNK